MKPADIKWINRNKVRKTLSNLKFQEDKVYPAHSLEQPGFIPYVPKKLYDELLEAHKMVDRTKNFEHSSDILKGHK